MGLPRQMQPAVIAIRAGMVEETAAGVMGAGAATDPKPQKPEPSTPWS